MLFKLLAVILLLFILASLASGLYFLVKDRENSERLVKALSVRIGLSILLFIVLMIGYATGFLAPEDTIRKSAVPIQQPVE